MDVSRTARPTGGQHAPSSGLVQAFEEFVQIVVNARLEALQIPAADTPNWMTTREAAAYLRMSEAALRKRVQRGRIAAYRDGSRLLFDRAELDSRVTLVTGNTHWGERRVNGPAPGHRRYQLP